METKLRIGGPVSWGGRRWIFAGNSHDGERYYPELLQLSMARYPWGKGWDHVVNTEKDSATMPAPYIPGDVVTHSLHPDYGRGLVVGATASHCRVVWQNEITGSYWADEDALDQTGHLTLILPAQES